MEPLDYLRLLRRRWALVLLAPMIAVAALWLVTPPPPEPEVDPLPPDQSFRATHVLFKTGDTGGISLELLGLQAESGVIPQRVVDRLGLEVLPQVLASEVIITTDSKIGTLTVTSTNRDGARAVLLANTFAEEIVAYLAERIEQNRLTSYEQARNRLALLEGRIRELDAQIAALPLGTTDRDLLTAEKGALVGQYAAAVNQVEEFSVAAPATGLNTFQEAVPIPISTEGGAVFDTATSRTGRFVVGAVVGLLLGVGLALAADRFDTRVRTRQGAKHAFGLPVVAEVPRLPRRARADAPVMIRQPASAAAEAFRALRLSIQLMPRWLIEPLADGALGDGDHQSDALRPHPGTERPVHTVLVTSAIAQEGKTTTAANLAASFAEAGRTVLVVDADVRHPQLHRSFGADASPGLSDYLTQGRTAHLAEVVRGTEIPGVSLIPGGAPVDNPPALRLDEGLIAAARPLADIVIIDSGPLLPVRGPSTLLPIVDAVVVVARSGRTTGEAARRTSEILAQVQAPVLGVALVALPRREFGRNRYGSGRRSVRRQRRAATQGAT